MNITFEQIKDSHRQQFNEFIDSFPFDEITKMKIEKFYEQTIDVYEKGYDMLSAESFLAKKIADNCHTNEDGFAKRVKQFISREYWWIKHVWKMVAASSAIIVSLLLFIWHINTSDLKEISVKVDNLTKIIYTAMGEKGVNHGK